MISNKKIVAHGIILVFAIAWYFFNYSQLKAPVDVGDGLMHFWISQASWSEHVLFLDHWGKPIFVLLSSPFAQFGFTGIFVFNVLVFIGTTLLGWKILHHFNVPSLVSVNFPLLLLLTADYSNTILGGLTEPLFSFFLLLALYFWVKKSFFTFAFVVGLLPFLRSEGQLAIILAFFMLLAIKNWKSLPILMLPFLLYALIGKGLLDDFWWYFNNSPYRMDNDIYGVGTFDHYVMSYKNYIGNHGLFLFVIALPILFYQVLKRKLNSEKFGFVFLSYGVFFGIVTAHSYFWGTGQNGSMGLTRITTQGLPSFLLVNLYFLSNYSFIHQLNRKTLLSILPLALIVYSVVTPYLKKTAGSMEIATNELYKNLDKLLPLSQTKVFSTSLHFMFLNGGNPKKTGDNLTREFQSYLLNELHEKKYEGSIVIWDSHFGPLDLKTPLDLLTNHPNLLLIDKQSVSGNVIAAFQCVDSTYKKESPPQLQTKTIKKPENLESKDEFLGLLTFAASDKNRTIKFTVTSSQPIFIVSSVKDGSQYTATEITTKNQLVQFDLPIREITDLYIWNPNKIIYSVQIGAWEQSTISFAKPWVKK